MSGQWAGSNRRSELPPDWPAIRAAILQRDHYRCQSTNDGPPCGQRARQVDHIQRGHDHQPSNLQALCDHHHAIKSSREGSEARWTPETRRARQAERHPGLL